jgi:hypothetical protein
MPPDVYISRASLPAILKLVLLWIVLFLFFGIVFVEVFSLTRWGKAETRYQNYTSLGRTLVMLAFMSTGFVLFQSDRQDDTQGLTVTFFTAKGGISTCTISMSLTCSFSALSANRD